jgi:PAS domain S-box-containing protein
MQSKFKNILAMGALLFAISALTTSVHALLNQLFLLTVSGFYSISVETILLVIASSPFLFIIMSQHKLLIRSEEKYRSLVEHNSALIFEFNLNGQLINANPVLMQATGYTLEEVLLKQYEHLVVREDARSAKLYFDRAKKGELLNFELSVLHKSGKVIELGVKSVPIFVGKDITGIFLIAKDITERKKSLQQLKSIKNQLESFINHASEAICLFDLEGKILQVNNALEQLFGWKEQELIGKEFPGIPYDLKPSLKQVYQQVVAKEQVTNFETIRYRKDGTLIYVSLTFSPILDVEENVIALSVIIRDITERKKMEEMLLKSEKLSIAGQLAAGVAHEIRNPLTTLRGFVQLMMNSGSSHDRYLDIMLSELDRINLIVGEFLILSKPHLRHFAAKDLRIILEEVITLLEPQALLGNIRFNLVIPNEAIIVGCEENELKQVFINLLKNAMEAMPCGGEIGIKAATNHLGQVLLRFMDEGCGIPPENLAKLGEPFFTTKEKGTGLGMMITYKIIEDHNGKISIQSKLNCGTTVEVLLPLHLSSTLQLN